MTKKCMKKYSVPVIILIFVRIATFFKRKKIASLCGNMEKLEPVSPVRGIVKLSDFYRNQCEGS